VNAGAERASQGPDVVVGATESVAAHNLGAGAGIVYDVYPTYHELLERCPVEHGRLHDHFATPLGWQYELRNSDGEITVHGYGQVQEMFRQSWVLSSAASYDEMLNESIGPSIIGMDEPEHRRMRMLLQPGFSRIAIERWKGEIIKPIVDEHLERIRPSGKADLYHEIAPNVPIQTISVALGLPARDQRHFFDWAVGMTSGTDPRRRLANALSVSDYIAPIIVERRARPTGDLLSILTQARIEADDAEDLEDARPLTDDEINSFVRLLIIAGAGTTYKAYGNLMFMLLTHPDALDAVRADRSRVPQAIEESLRIETPVASMRRRAIADTAIDGVAIPSGCPVTANLAAANHDRSVWGDDSDEFDIDRDRPDRHLTFGFGVHRCLGIHLARAELNVLCNRTLDLLPNVRLDKDEPAPRMTGLGLRMPTSLPAVWDV
jgi:cytochrome P450